MMKVYSTIDDIFKFRYQQPLAGWSLVPTMGYLHQGHLSLVRRARDENDLVAVSIFVNPAQFNNPADLANYPRDNQRDFRLLEHEGVDLIWIPEPDMVYPSGYQTYVEVEGLTNCLEGTSRPGYFRGVTTIVAKLFNIFHPQRAYFGQKDYQQARVIKQMVKDLNFNIDVVICPTVREPDGLAMSSRNVRLSPIARQQATCLYGALAAAKSAFEAGQRNARELRSKMLSVLDSVKSAQVDYVSVAHPQTLEELEIIEEQALISLAVFIEDVRLIDNIVVNNK
jgi:pantoate--beta-alanine ligase